MAGGRERLWGVGVKWPDGTRWGSITIRGDIASKEKRSLDTIANAIIGSAKTERLVGKVRTHRPRGGECRVFVLEGKTDGFCGDTDGLGGSAAACIEMLVTANCYNAKAQYFSLHARLGNYDERGQPDQLTRDNAQRFERFLQSLEFK